MTKRILWIVCAVVAAGVAVAVMLNMIVVWNAAGRMFDDVGKIPHNKMGLLLGTSPVTPDGRHNYYFDNRIEAADQLFKAGKIDMIIVSGGNYTGMHRNGCDEPAAMRDSLVARGVDEDKIFLDYTGTRTVNSFITLCQAYRADSVTIISQEYHNPRALYIADNMNVKAVAYNAPETAAARHKIKNHVREYFARIKMFFDFL